MDELTAWKMFSTTGKIEDYINYAHVKNETSKDTFNCVDIRETDDNKNRGTCN